MLGYVTHALRDTRPSPLPMQSARAFDAWIDNYCTKNPLDAVATATDALVDELKRRRP